MSFDLFATPTQLSELLFAAQSTHVQIQQFAASNPKPNLLLFGPPGTAKSTSAKVLLHECVTKHCGSHPSVYTIHASNFCNTAEIDNLFNMQLITSGSMLCIIEEYDKLSPQKMFDLRGLLDKRKGKAAIIATTNNIANIDAAMRSRFKCIEMLCPPALSFVPKVQQYLQSLNISLSDKAVLNVIEAAGSDIRKIGDSIDELVFAHQNPQLFMQVPKAK